MSLYPMTILTQAEAESGNVPIGNGALIAIPLTVTATSSQTILVVFTPPFEDDYGAYDENPPGQDFSLRCFISTKPAGESVPGIPQVWHASRTPTDPVILCAPARVTSPTAANEIVATPFGFTDENTAVLTGAVIVVQPGQYYLNILNLVNKTSAFALSIIDN